MFPVSARFLPALAQSWQLATRVDVLQSGVVIYSPLAISKGKVTIDRNASNRRSCSLTILDPSGALTPKQMGDLLSPYGNEVALYRGLTYTDKTTELCPLGIFRIASAKIKDDASGIVTAEVQGIDRSKYVGRQDFASVYQIPGGTNVNTAIAAILNGRVPANCQLSMAPSSITTPVMTHGIGDTTNPWGVIQMLADMDACQAYFDYVGNFVKAPIPNPSNLKAVQSILDGDGGTLISVEREMSEDKIYNHVIIHNEDKGSALHPPVTGEAKITDATSPMYYAGPFGDVIKHIVSPLASSTSSAAAIAANELLKYVGKTDSIVLEVVPNPALDIDDVVYVRRAKSGLLGNYVVDAIDMQMDLSGHGHLTVRKV